MLVSDLATSVIGARKVEDSKLLELEKLKLERSKNDLELACFRAILKTKTRRNNAEKN